MELKSRNVPYTNEKLVPIRYRGALLCHQRIDLLIDNQVEVKSVERLGPIHTAQVINYLRVTGARAALLVSFNVPIVKQGIRRIVL